MRSAAPEAGRWRRRQWFRFHDEDFCDGESRRGQMSDTNIQEVVKHKYGQAAKQVSAGGTACCGGGGELSGCDPITKNLYDEAQKSGLPAEAVAASLGCGNPTALAKLQAGELVLGLGAGGGSAVLLSPTPGGARGRDRCASVGEARGADGKSVRAGHDGRDAGAGAGESEEGGRDECGVS